MRFVPMSLIAKTGSPLMSEAGVKANAACLSLAEMTKANGIFISTW